MTRGMLGDPLAHFLLAVAVVILFSHALGALLGRWGQPPVVGELIGGLLLGPTIFGALLPQTRDWIFTPETLRGLDVAAQLGLVVFMFLVGSELRLNTVKKRGGVLAAMVTGAMGLPFVAGLGVALVGRDLIAGSAGHRTAYLVFVALALSVTALPVLARILADLKLDGSPLGSLALACAAAGDVIVWAVLTVTLAVLTLSGTSAALTAGLLVVLVLIAGVSIRPLLAAVVRRADRDGAPGRILMPVLVGCALAFAAAFQMIGLHPVIGAFLFGTLVPRDSAAVALVRSRLEGFTVVLLLPLFFAGVGLRTSIDFFRTGVAPWLLLAGVVLVAVVSKFVGAGGAARLAGVPTPDALRLGALMNCRGVTEMVVATIGWQYHLINDLGLTILVVVALVTTAATGPAIRLLQVRYRLDSAPAEPHLV